MPEDTVTIPEVHIDVDKERQKPRLTALLFVDFSNRTRSNKHNLLGVFDHIYVDPETKKTPRFGVYIRTAQIWDKSVDVTIISPDHHPVAGFTYQINSAEVPDSKRLSAIDSIFSFNFETTIEGRYWFDVTFDGQSLGGADLLVEFRKGRQREDGNTAGDA